MQLSSISRVLQVNPKQLGIVLILSAPQRPARFEIGPSEREAESG
jgi:hypothetical protein